MLLCISEFQAWPSPRANPQEMILERRILHSPVTKKVNPWGRKIVLRPHPRDNYFRKTSKKIQNIRNYENSTELLICVEILKQWNI